MYQEITQYFRVTITTSKDTLDVTSDIGEGLRLENEDGMISKLTFSMKEGYTNMDKLVRGMTVDMYGGDLNTNKLMFSGKIMELVPDFTESGEVFLGVTCQGGEKVALGRLEKDLVYPSKNHPSAWGRRNTTCSEIILNLARDSNYNIDNSNISVKKDINVSFKNPVRQKGKSDWAFMQELAEKIRCTLWVKKINGKETLFLKDDSHLVNVLSNKVFYYLARTHRSDFIEINRNDPKMIKMEKLTINLESSTGVMKQKVNPKTGKSEVVAEIPKDGAQSTDETGQPVERWVLDEAKVRALSGDARKDLINSFIDGRVEWESSTGGVSAKPYFKLVTGDESSRSGQNNNIEIEVSEDSPEVSKNGITTENPSKEQTGSRTYKTVINEELVRGLSSEERTALMSRIVRRDTKPSDSKYYTVVDTTPKPEKDDQKPAPTKNEPKGVGAKKVADKSAKSEKGKRDAGFKIEATIFGRPDIETKASHLLQGLGKYSGKYYAYRTVHSWGNNGWEITITFVK